MKPITALILSLVAGISTFAAEHYFFPAQLHAAPFVVPQTPDWRQQMIDHDPGGAVVDHVLAHLTDRLELTEAQTQKTRPLLERQHERILSLLLNGPTSLSRGQFMTQRKRIKVDTRRQLDALLTPEQLAIAKDLHPHPVS
jgi:hypothetical protein